ncbi:hypothetical protein HYZ41_00370 [archaeon]|nr:hypothetical protein [archaeon]
MDYLIKFGYRKDGTFTGSKLNKNQINDIESAIKAGMLRKYELIESPSRNKQFSVEIEDNNQYAKLDVFPRLESCDTGRIKREIMKIRKKSGNENISIRLYSSMKSYF